MDDEIHYCCGISDVNDFDPCYLFRSIKQGETVKAVQWLNLWKDILNSSLRICVI
jgi:hypothetical protein